MNMNTYPLGSEHSPATRTVPVANTWEQKQDEKFKTTRETNNLRLHIRSLVEGEASLNYKLYVAPLPDEAKEALQHVKDEHPELCREAVIMHTIRMVLQGNRDTPTGRPQVFGAGKTFEEKLTLEDRELIAERKEEFNSRNIDSDDYYGDLADYIQRSNATDIDDVIKAHAPISKDAHQALYT